MSAITREDYPIQYLLASQCKEDFKLCLSLECLSVYRGERMQTANHDLNKQWQQQARALSREARGGETPRKNKARQKQIELILFPLCGHFCASRSASLIDSGRQDQTHGSREKTTPSSMAPCNRRRIYHATSAA